MEGNLKNSSMYRGVLYSHVILIFLTVFSCNSKETLPEELQFFHIELEEETEERVLFDLRNIEEDSLNNFYFMLKDVVELLKIDTNANNFLESKGIYRDADKFYIILKSFHRKLNNKEIHFEKLLKEVRRYLEEIEAHKFNLEKCTKERARLAEENYERWKIGDTLNISFPFSKGSNNRNAVYYGCTTNYDSIESDFLFLSGVLKGKDTIDPYTNRAGLNFNLKVLTISEDNALILLRKIEIGDSLDVNLNSYGRLITK